MGISEALIIYLAIGAPLGVYAIVRPQNFLENLAGILAANVLLWPIFASLEFIPRSESSHGSNHFIDSRSDSADDLEKAWAFNASFDHIADRRSRREALEAFERFAALLHAASDTDTGRSISVPKIFEMAGHANPTLAAKCLSRRNAARLKGHLRRAEAICGQWLMSLRPEIGHISKPLLLKRGQTFAIPPFLDPPLESSTEPPYYFSNILVI